MAGKTVNFNSSYNVHESYAEEITKWLSCNGEAWGVGPTAVFAAAAALFLHHEVRASLLAPGDRPRATPLEHTLIVSMVLGTLALMVHVWVCLMRFFQYYLDTLIRDSPNVLLEMTTAGLLGAGQAELAALGPLTRFLRQQQPQVHITVCWLLALCYADYVRKHCCSFNVPYLEQWQTELHEQARRRMRGVLASVSSCAGAVHSRLRGFAPPPRTTGTEAHTVALSTPNVRWSASALLTATCPGPTGPSGRAGWRTGAGARERSAACTTSRAAPPPSSPPQRRSRSLERTSTPPAAPAPLRVLAARRLPLSRPPRRREHLQRLGRLLEPWYKMSRLLVLARHALVQCISSPNTSQLNTSAAIPCSFANRLRQQLMH